MQMKEWEGGTHMEVAWSGKESECEPNEKGVGLCVGAGRGGKRLEGQCEKSKPSSVSGEYGANSSGKQVI